MARGKFITLEGGEGAGKSTQISLLADALRETGLSVHTTREPGGSAGAEDIRKLLVTGEAGRWDAMSEALLHFAARRDHVQKTILPKLEAGTWVLSDRFADSTMAYQGYAQGLGRDAVETLYQLTLGDFRPDLTLILDLEVEAGLARAAARQDGEDRYERLGTAFHQRLRDAFHDLAKRAPERCVLVDAGGDIGAVHAALRATVAARLGISLP
jgi:dTMP kinase